MSKLNTIQYGIGREYLSDWGIPEAIREIYQNFMDHGEYKVVTKYLEDDKILVKLVNDFTPHSLDFLKIGHSRKDGDQNIGKHGEGLKMAMMIFSREDKHCHVITGNKLYTPTFVHNGGIEDCFAIDVWSSKSQVNAFVVEFICDSTTFTDFDNHVIKPEDILFDNKHDGKVVNKPAGELYCGGLFVCVDNKLTRAYDVLPRNMHLDRDRKVPRNIDVVWHTGRINRDYDKWEFSQQQAKDVEDIDVIPERLQDQLDVTIVKGNVLVVYNDPETKQTRTLNNISLISAAHQIPRIKDKIEKLQKVKAKKRLKPHRNCTSIVGALNKFKVEFKGYLPEYAKADLNDIICKIKKGDLK